MRIKPELQPRHPSATELIGAAVITCSVIGLVVAAFDYGSGDEVAFVGGLVAFAAGVTGVGIVVAGRNSQSDRPTTMIRRELREERTPWALTER